MKNRDKLIDGWEPCENEADGSEVVKKTYDEFNACELLNVIVMRGDLDKVLETAKSTLNPESPESQKLKEWDEMFGTAE